ncbi:MAG TPA: nucleotidyltransferase domain-containing protein [Bacteroidia bacterium]|nr:nucleotidyltransferase domain-containing protein [Bacteroidia bacterium]HNU32494.1 nucleotidyltransferase domain-containing protein [Bacteroidia bacterium]
MQLINQNIQAINELCRKHKVKELYAFGSVVDERKFNEKSDVDLIVKFDNIPVENYADYYFDLAEGFEKLFDRKVDLLIDKPIKNPYFKEAVEESKTMVYAA